MIRFAHSHFGPRAHNAPMVVQTHQQHCSVLLAFAPLLFPWACYLVSAVASWPACQEVGVVVRNTGRNAVLGNLQGLADSPFFVEIRPAAMWGWNSEM